MAISFNPRRQNDRWKWTLGFWGGLALALLIGFLLTWNTFFKYVPPGWHLVIVAKDGAPLPPGHVLAEPGQKGPLAAVRGEGDVASLPLQDVAVPAEGVRIAALLTAAGITPSNSEANRKLKERSVRVDGEVFEDAARVFAPGFEGVVAVGKRNFARVRLVTAG